MKKKQDAKKKLLQLKAAIATSELQLHEATVVAEELKTHIRDLERDLVRMEYLLLVDDL
jgi:hypothetical protein